MSFSPVAGIQWVETLLSSPALSLRLLGFSPVAGIQWVETQERPDDFSKEVMSRFSPVAGIQWVETFWQCKPKAQKYCFSPVAGIQWVETKF